MKPPLFVGVLFLICQWRPSSMDVDSKSKWVDKKNDDSCRQQSENEKLCLSELEQLRQRVILCDTLSYTVEFLREQLNASKAREENLTNALQHVSNKFDGVKMGSKQSSQEEEGKQEPLLWTLHQSWDPTWSFLTDASRLEVYTIDKDKRFAKRENVKDRGFLPLFVEPGLAVGKVHEASFRIWQLCEDWVCEKDGLAVGVNAGIDVGEQQIWSSAASLVVLSLDGTVYELTQKGTEPKWALVTYIGRPLVKLDVITVQVDLTRALPLVKFAVNGAFGRQIILQLPNEKIKQLRFVVETFAKDVTIEII